MQRPILYELRTFMGQPLALPLWHPRRRWTPHQPWLPRLPGHGLLRAWRDLLESWSESSRPQSQPPKQEKCHGLGMLTAKMLSNFDFKGERLFHIAYVSNIEFANHLLSPFSCWSLSCSVDPCLWASPNVSRPCPRFTGAACTWSGAKKHKKQRKDTKRTRNQDLSPCIRTSNSKVHIASLLHLLIGF